MRDKHIHIAEDSQLLKTLYRSVDEQLNIQSVVVNRMLIAKLLVYAGSSILFYYALLTTQTTSLFFSYFILYGFASLLFAFNFSHDFSHNTVFKSKKANNFCFTLIYTIVGAHAEAWKQRHVQSHHYAPNVADYDSDLKITHLIRVIPNSLYLPYHRFQHLYAPLAYTTYSLYWVFIKDFVILFSNDEYTEHKGLTYHLSFWAQKISYLLYLVVIPMLFSHQAWYIVLIAFLLMHMMQSLFLLFTFFMTHHVENTAYPVTDHNGFIQSSWVMNQIKSSNDMHPFSTTANFILGGFNNHIAHHLFPHIHHIHYPRLNKIIYPILNQHNIIPNQTSYWGGIISHLKLLKRMGQQETA